MYIHASPTSHPPASLLGAFCYREPCAHVLGQGLVEYALVLVLIAIVTIGVISLIGRKTSQVFSQVNCTLAGDSGHTHEDHGQGHSNRGGCD